MVKHIYSKKNEILFSTLSYFLGEINPTTRTEYLQKASSNKITEYKKLEKKRNNNFGEIENQTFSK